MDAPGLYPYRNGKICENRRISNENVRKELKNLKYLVHYIIGSEFLRFLSEVSEVLS